MLFIGILGAIDKVRYKNMGKNKRVYSGSTTSTTELGEKPAKNEKGIGKFTNSDGSDRGNVLKRKEHTNVMKKEMAKSKKTKTWPLSGNSWTSHINQEEKK